MMFAPQPPMDKPGDFEGTPLYGAPTYGNAPNISKTNLRRHKRHVGIPVLVLCLIIPIGVYAAVGAVLSFRVRHNSPGLAYFVAGLAFAAVIAVGALGFTAARRRFFQGDFNREPYWYIFLTLSMLAAWIFAVCLGDMNFSNNTVPYEDLQNLSTHPNVDPGTTSSRQVMDVGRVMFVEGSALDLTKSVGFKNSDRYCVAPITKKGKKMENYDFWAIGLNCCSGDASDFHCGEFDNPEARGGLRLMRADQRAFYRLAVQQAAATFNLRAESPLFFYWMQNPLAEMDSYMQDAMKTYLQGLFTAIFCQVLLLVLAVLGHS
eukprot:CAMPEP_0175683444 /NCGR_PEP_ID=MMETSP0097-20121207/26330_1 /TAXON_ID=311494 /ORGANISM="Alexandrium monilatum, Strain CCMP3105" /LENGTH=318 /DNA_ID=CAMNT_0016990353 /DNA_START=54 /DNA_END=1007 /DNA_ORIENTATION=-